MDRWLIKDNKNASSTNSETSRSPCRVSHPSAANLKTCESTKKRKYDESYLALGFTYTGNTIAPDALCVICNKVLSNSSLLPAKLRRHLETNHPECKNKNIHFFQRKLEGLKQCQNTLVKSAKTDNENATEASYRVSYRIALAGEAHNIAETLIKPCAIDMATCLLEEQHKNKFEMVQLSNNTVKRRIEDLSTDIERQLVSRLNSTFAFSLQLDESTDVAGLAVLLVFVRYVFENKIEEDLLLCKSLESRTTGKDIFSAINRYMSEHQISWEKCIDVCTDGAKAMTGKTAGVVSRIKAVSPSCASSHCILHRQALVVRTMEKDLKTVLDDVVKIVNYIKSRPLNARLFKLLCEEMGSTHTTLLLHTEVRWLSRGKVLVRVFELRSEIWSFFVDYPFHLSECLRNTTWLQQLAYLADIFTKANELNISCQGKSVSIFTARDKIVSFQRKLEFWKKCIEKKQYECFPTLSDFLLDTETCLEEAVVSNIIQHLTGLQESFQKYFPPSTDEDNWIRNPFSTLEKPDNMTGKIFENLLDLTSDTVLKQRFSELAVTEFWCSLLQEYSEISKYAVAKLLPFPTTYLCEVGFSRYAATKSKFRHRLDATSDMRIQLSSISPNLKEICETRKQHHSSH